jgi:hypothetical protein
MKGCKILMNFCRICKKSDHNKDQCPSKSVTSICSSREMISIHVVQVE